MGEIIASIRHGLAGLLRFSGRDTRKQFWPYAIFVFLAASLLSYLVVLPELARMMGRMLRIAAEQGDRPLEPHEIEPLLGEVMPNFDFFIVTSVIINIVAMMLLAAAVVRRLHDCDRRGLWGLVPLPSFALGLALAPMALEIVRHPVTPDMNMMMWPMLNSVLTWGLFIFLIVLLAREGTKGPNRFGPEPAEIQA
ncbi:MAG TPA: DUF805 domain-containing protein [Allosphingosinicella sp.]|nr:DUF805 domain-containing protein [Allosphingosinicella sp.]